MRYLDVNKKEKIMLAAIQLINEVGLAETSMAKIAQKAGVAAGTIYVYFENKEDMIKKLFLAVKEAMQQNMFRGIDCSLSIEVEFKQLLKNYIDFIVNHKDCFLFFEQYINSPLIDKLCGEELQIATKPLRDFFESGKERGIFRPIDLDLLVTYTFTPLMQMAKKHFNGEFGFTEQNIEEMIQMCWASIKA
ncbi:MAG TPA: TetR family transcriptional regulator [Firmicutes bacterium]|nr:TetR family transcriptional regulator [Bacillota bacterium]